MIGKGQDEKLGSEWRRWEDDTLRCEKRLVKKKQKRERKTKNNRDTKISSKCQHDLVPTCLCDELRRPADTEARRRLRSASSTSLDLRRTRLSTVGDRTFPVTASRLWNSLPSHVTAALFLPIFCCHLKSHLFSLSYPAFWLLSHLYNVRAVTRHFGHYNRFYIFLINA